MPGTRSRTSPPRTQVEPRGYLYDCLALHGQVMEIRYGRKQDRQDLFRIEDDTGGVLSSGRLTYEDLERIRNGRVWNADAFGYWPSRSEVESSLESTEWSFRTLPEKEEQVVADLLKVFRQIELVSVVLRFVAPRHYGILSPPVEQVLGIGPFRNHAGKYLAYLHNLREIRDERRFRSAAEVDMALWVLQVGVLERRLERALPDMEEEWESLHSGYKNDSRLHGIRFENLAQQLFLEMSHLELSEALLPTNVELAGQLAGIQFEKDVRKLTGAKSGDKLRKLVDRIRSRPASRQIRDLPDAFWSNAVDTRNNAIHLSQWPRKGDVMKLIEGMKALRRLEGGDQLDEPPAVPADFREWRPVDEVAEEQGIVAPQPLDSMIGAAADLWDSEEDFERFVNRGSEHRHRAGKQVEDEE